MLTTSEHLRGALVPGRVSIGMPVYNGERFIRETLENLLQQTYADFRLTVCDNASSDSTVAIVREFVARDARIELEVSPMNRGAVYNFNRAAEVADGEFFMWAGDHDLWEPTYITKCVQLLRADASLAMVYARTRLIDEVGETLLDPTPDEIDTRGVSTVRGFQRLIWNLEWCNMFHGVMRTALRRTTAPIINTWGADQVFLADLATRGAFAQLPETLFFRRRNRPPETAAEQQRRVAEALDPKVGAAQKPRSFAEQSADLLRAQIAVARRAPWPWWRRARAELAARVCFYNRWSVPLTGFKMIDRVVNNGLHRVGLVRWLS